MTSDPIIESGIEAFMDDARQLAAQCWCDDANRNTEMDADLAESMARRLAAWMDTAAQMSRNAEFYRGLITRCGVALGPEAFTCDDGTVVPDVLALKVPEIIERMFPKPVVTGWNTSVLEAAFHVAKPSKRRIQ